MATSSVFTAYLGTEKEDMASYLERFDMFLLINDVEDAQKVPHLLTYIGPDAYKVLKDLCVPDLPRAKTYEQLVDMLKNHYTPIQLSSVERMKFRHRRQQSGESITQFIHALKAASKSCDFGQNLNENLRDQFIYGLCDNRIARQLLAKVNLTFERACEQALQTEVALKESCWISEKSPSSGAGESVHAVRNSKRSSKGQERSSPKAYEGKPCYRCGDTGHWANKCKTASYKCRTCGKIGHISKMCKSKPSSAMSAGSAEVQAVSEEVGHLFLNQLHEGGNEPLFKELELNGFRVKFEVDCGASVTVLSEEQWKAAGEPKLKRSFKRLNAANKSPMDVLGEATFSVKNVGELSAIIVKNSLRYPLLGRPWLDIVKPEWRKTFEVKQVKSKSDFVDYLKEKFPGCFQRDNFSSIKGYKANVVLKEDAVPVFQKSYGVPYALKEQVNEEIERLIKVGTFVPVKYSEWASPIVVVKKPNGQVRLCCDYKRTVNPQLLRDVYPLPTIEDIFASMAGSNVFCVVDLYQAYMQLELGEESTKLLVVNTPCGLMKVTKLPYGVSSAPLIFQSIMDRVLQGIRGLRVYQDDIIVGGETVEECQKILLQVFERLAEANIKVNSEKCKFFEERVTYLGHVLCSEGIQPKMDKMQAIQDAPIPNNVSVLKAWLGMLNFYRHLVENLSEIVHPLNELTQKGVKYVWGEAQQRAFLAAKNALLSAPVLNFYDPGKKTILTCDSSSYGIGSVLSQVDENGVERPVLFHSATLSKALQKCSQTEKEAFAIVASVKKFHKYVYGRKFVIRTDHKALEYIFAPNKNVPAMTAAKLQRWSLFLAAYDYELNFVPGKDISNADGLSRNPLPVLEEDVEVVHGLSLQENIPVTAKDVAACSKKDELLSRVLQYVWKGWPRWGLEGELKTFYLIRDELSVEEGVLIRGHKIVIPKALRVRVLEEIHLGHPGVVRSKARARAVVWWPGIDRDIENHVKGCMPCQVNSQVTTDAKTGAIWAPTQRSFERVHIDFFELDSVKYLILVDAHTGWIECWRMGKTDVSAVIEKLSLAFATFGLPVSVVSDNGPPFNSSTFADYLARNGIKNVHSPPYHPNSNSYAERGVGTIKLMMRTMGPQTKLSNVLFHVHMTPRSSGLSPYEQMFKRTPNTRLTLLQPNHVSSSTVLNCKSFDNGQNVYVSTKGRDGPNWEPGMVVERMSPTTYTVDVNGRTRLTHVDFVRPMPDVNTKAPTTEVGLDAYVGDSAETVPQPETATVEPDSGLPGVHDGEPTTPVVPDVDTSAMEADDGTIAEPAQSPANVVLRRSARIRVAPNRLNL